jgi:hypothetical protein
MLTNVDDQDRVQREKDEWQGSFEPRVEVVTVLCMLAGLFAVIALIGWLIPR